jgi:hypothetical protein
VQSYAPQTYHTNGTYRLKPPPPPQQQQQQSWLMPQQPYQWQSSSPPGAAIHRIQAADTPSPHSVDSYSPAAGLVPSSGLNASLRLHPSHRYFPPQLPSPSLRPAGGRRLEPLRRSPSMLAPSMQRLSPSRQPVPPWEPPRETYHNPAVMFGHFGPSGTFEGGRSEAWRSPGVPEPFLDWPGQRSPHVPVLHDETPDYVIPARSASRPLRRVLSGPENYGHHGHRSGTLGTRAAGGVQC